MVPTIATRAGTDSGPNYNEVMVPDPPPQVPDGFVPLFNGKDLSGWHISKTARHGHTPEFRVVHGVLVGTQHPYAQGGMLVTDRKYRNFELTLEAKPDWGCDSGIFFRATESGAAYQITMDYLGNGNGNLGRMIGEGGISLAREDRARSGGTPDPARSGDGDATQDPTASQAWKREDWNLIRDSGGRRRAEGDRLDQQSTRERAAGPGRITRLTAWSRDRSRSRCMAERSAGSRAASGAGAISASRNCRD